LILAHPADTLHPLRSAELLRDRLPCATLRVAPSAAYCREHPEALVDLIATFVHGHLSIECDQPLR
jgi:hypothetical protein